MPYVTTLTEADLEFGKQLTQQLKDTGFPFEGAFWLYDEEADDWRLVVVTSLLDEEGRLEAYRRLTQVIPGSRWSSLRLNLTVMSPQNPTFTALKKTFANGKSVEGVRLQHQVVNGVLIPAAYLYEIRK